jgi:hypothetical protein
VTRCAYRLTAWPELPAPLRTVPVLRTLSRMTVEPVTREWFLELTRLGPEQAEALLEALVAQDCVQLFDCTAAADPGGCECLRAYLRAEALRVPPGLPPGRSGGR